MTRTAAASALVCLVLSTPPHAQTPTLTPQEKQVVDAQTATPRLDSTVTIASLKLKTTVAGALRTLSETAGLITKSDQNLRELDTTISIEMNNVPLDEAVKAVLGGTGIAWVTTGPKSVFLYLDTPANRRKFEQRIQTFAIRIADPSAIVQRLVTQPFMSEGPRPVLVTANSSRAIVVRATADQLAEIAKFISANDK